jgi:hypothetical protein
MANLEHIDELIKVIPQVRMTPVLVARAAAHAAAVQAVRNLSTAKTAIPDDMFTITVTDSGVRNGMMIYRCNRATIIISVHAGDDGDIVVEAASAMQPHSFIHFYPKSLFNAGVEFNSVKCFTTELHTLTLFVQRQIYERTKAEFEICKLESTQTPPGGMLPAMGMGMFPPGWKIFN